MSGRGRPDARLAATAPRTAPAAELTRPGALNLGPSSWSPLVRSSLGGKRNPATAAAYGRKPSMQTRTKREKVGRRLVAMTLAREMAEAVGAGEEEGEELVGVALAVGQWLAEEGRPGRWDTIAPAEVLRVIALPAGNETSGFLLSLAGLVGHAALQGDVEQAAACRILLEIAGLADSPPGGGVRRQSRGRAAGRSWLGAFITHAAI